MKTVFTFLVINIFFCLHISAQFNSFVKNERMSDVALYVPVKRTETANVQNNSLVQENLSEYKASLENIFSSYLHLDEVDKNTPIIYLPLNNISYNSFYGYRYHPIDKKIKFHYGVDLFARSDSVYAMVGGIISNSGYSSSLGYFVTISYNEYKFTYGHLSEYYVLTGSLVQAGQLIGRTGNTGKSTGEHLHFAIKKNDKFINPITFLENIKNNLL